MSDTKSIRQVLMNEMGLTRDSIRAEMERIVAQEVVKIFTRMERDNTIKNLVSAEFNKLVMGDTHWDRTTLRDLVIGAAKKEAEEFIKANLRFGVASATGQEEDE